MNYFGSNISEICGSIGATANIPIIMSEVESFEVPVTGGVIVGTRTGDGPPLVLLHGGPGLSDYMGSLVDELSTGYTVLRYQQRGLQPSTTSGPFTVEAHASDALAVLRAVAPAGAVVIGHSWGGYLAMHLATLRSNLIVGLVVIDPLGVIGDGGAADMTRMIHERTPPEAWATVLELDERAMSEKGTTEDAVQGFALIWPAYFADPASAPAMPPISIALDCSADTVKSVHDQLAKQTVAGLLPRVTIPTIFVMGASSPIPPRYGLASAALIPGARTEVLEGCGHFPWLERPGVIRNAVDSIHAI
ncbi:MAG TPA: alpha/beta hydrolase [Acidimicrobiales bacterium]|nr:alpha/beta hydrolase [Acidimicrobiales bacterium]